MADRFLNARAVRRWRSQLGDQLGRADRLRFEALIDLIGPDGRIRLAAALAGLFPDHERNAALAALRQFRARLASAATESRIVLSLETDGQTRTTPEHRFCWFAGDDGALLAGAEHSEAEIGNVTRTGQDAVLVQSRPPKRVMRYFVSYAHKDSRLAAELVDHLASCFGTSRRYEFRRWRDDDILLGADWHADIQAAIRECDFGLLLITTHFLSSRYITHHELPHFVPVDGRTLGEGKRAAPVLLRPLPSRTHIDMRGLAERQIFRDADGKAFADRGGERRQAFARALFERIADMLDALPPAPQPPPPHAPPPPEDPLAHYGRGMRDRIDLPPTFIRAHGEPSSMEKFDASETPQGERRDALQFLLDWAADPAGEPYCALLGQLGMGKTTNAMAFARELLAHPGTGARVPIYLDLRLLGEAGRAEPDLDRILTATLRGSWKGGATAPPLSAAEAIEAVRSKGAVVIFDGLDEVLVHLSLADGQKFARELFRILPPNLVHPPRGAPPPPGRLGRVLVTCRTHFFRTVRDRKTYLTAEDRDRVRADDYRVLVLLPFEAGQIRTYLHHSVPEIDADRALGTLRTVHNLMELAERPYTLSLITALLPRIEQWSLEGRTITGAVLYREMVLAWLERDRGKHQIEPDHKLRLMEHLAAAFWRSRQRDWDVQRLEDWLVDLLQHQPTIAMHYHDKDRGLLKEDLRTATFLVDTGEDRFRFAHTSLLEFFLASHLLRALREGTLAEWALPRPSPETLQFLGQLEVADPSPATRAGMRALQAGYRADASENLLAYSLAAAAAGLPIVPVAGMDLAGANLAGWQLAGKPGAPINLRGVDLRGARLARARLHHVDLDGADLRQADASHAEFIEAGMRGARLAESVLTGTLFRAADLSRAGFAASQLHRTQFLRCDLTGSDLPPPALPHCVAALSVPARPVACVLRRAARFAVFTGHAGNAGCLTADHRGRLVTGGRDGTICIWDPASEELLVRLDGHSGAVASLTVLPDGRLASAGADGTIRLWDPVRGVETAQLAGHTGWVRSLAMLQDGRLASGSADGTIRLWDPARGVETARLEGHTDWVRCLAVLPDGRFASGGDDGKIRLWDPARGVATGWLEGHTDWVRCLSVLPDGRLASGGDDGKIHLWDPARGVATARPAGHRGGVRSLAVLPDARLASAGHNGTIRLWDPVRGVETGQLAGHTGWVDSLAMLPDGRLAAGGADGTIRLWDPARGVETARLAGHTGWVQSLAVLPDGRLASGEGDGTIHLWNSARGVETTRLVGHTGLVWNLAVLPDGRLVSAGNSGKILLWDPARGVETARLEGHTDWVLSLAVLPDERLASGGDDGTIRLWDPARGIETARLEGHTGRVWSLAVLPDGRIASASDDRTIRLWDPTRGVEIARLEGRAGWVQSLAALPGGRLASGGDDGTIRLWDYARGVETARLAGHTGPVWSLAVLPDGRLASAGEDGTIRLWDPARRVETARLAGHTGWVLSLAVLPDGRLASGSWDGTILLWDPAQHRPSLAIHTFADGAWLTLDPARNRPLHSAGDAWRWVGWAAPGPDGALTRYPAETFGPLPGP